MGFSLAACTSPELERKNQALEARVLQLESKIAELQANDRYFVERDNDVKRIVNNQAKTIRRVKRKVDKIEFVPQPGGRVFLKATGMPGS